MRNLQGWRESVMSVECSKYFGNFKKKIIPVVWCLNYYIFACHIWQWKGWMTILCSQLHSSWHFTFGLIEQDHTSNNFVLHKFVFRNITWWSFKIVLRRKKYPGQWWLALFSTKWNQCSPKPFLLEKYNFVAKMHFVHKIIKI